MIAVKKNSSNQSKITRILPWRKTSAIKQKRKVIAVEKRQQENKKLKVIAVAKKSSKKTKSTR